MKHFLPVAALLITVCLSAQPHKELPVKSNETFNISVKINGEKGPTNYGNLVAEIFPELYQKQFTRNKKADYSVEIIIDSAYVTDAKQFFTGKINHAENYRYEIKYTETVKRITLKDSQGKILSEKKLPDLSCIMDTERYESFLTVDETNNATSQYSIYGGDPAYYLAQLLDNSKPFYVQRIPDISFILKEFAAGETVSAANIK
ncbi:MAG: hypothetical protein ABI921_09400 [Panacibacter sp.]